MPIFEYHCEECKATFERLVLRPQAGTAVHCPQCSSVQTTKLFSTFCAHGSPATTTAGMSAPSFR